MIRVQIKIKCTGNAVIAMHIISFTVEIPGRDEMAAVHAVQIMKKTENPIAAIVSFEKNDAP